MANNPYPIQIKKRMLFNLMSIIIIFSLSILLILANFIANNDFIGILFIVVAVGLANVGVIFIIMTAWTLLYLKSLEYSLDNKSITFKGGVISRFEKVIPYSKIQHVIVYESVWQRILGVASISIETARESGLTNPKINWMSLLLTKGSSGITLTGPMIPDLKKQDAEKLKSYIIAVSNNYKPVAGI